MITEKSIWEHVTDFYEGVASTPEGLYDFGNYLARITGFRDWQVQHNSVLPIDYDAQMQAIVETKATAQLLLTPEGRKLVINALLNDLEAKPAYYLSALLSSVAIAKVLKNKLASTSIAALKLEGVTTNLSHSVLEEIKKQANLSDAEFNELVNSNLLKQNIENEMNHYIETLYEDDPELEPNPNPEDPNPEDPNPEDPDPDGHPIDPAPIDPPRHDPLALDMDKDGFIATTSLEDSSTYFDLTGDGLKEKVGWIQSSDGLVAYDKDNNGKIEGIDEVFGNQTTSGFDELRQIADSNHDGVIDRKDELYSRLKVWQDTNQDGISQADELVGLKEAGVTSINLDAISVNIEVNGNLISEASKYTDNEGNLELAADVELAFDSRLTSIDTSTIPDYTEHPDTSTLPFLRAYGVVYDADVAYNLDDNFRELAKELAGDVTQVANKFDEYMDGWSGYNQMQADLQEKYNLTDTPKLSDVERKIWTYERFMGRGTFTPNIEAKLESTAKNMQTGGTDTAPSGRYNTGAVHTAYNNFTNRNRAFFSLKAFYPDILEGNAQYQRGIDEFVITDQDALSTKVTEYINNADNTLEEKLYLAETMNILQGTFLDFNQDAIITNIDDTLVKNFVSGIYDDTLNTSIYNTSGVYESNSLILGTDEAETLEVNATNATTLAGKGDDIIVGSNTNNTYIYRNGDGSDTITDRGGNDTLNFSDISSESVNIYAEGDDLVIEQGENKVTITNWIDSANRIENIIFSDGVSPDFSQIIKDNFITDNADSIDLTSSDDTVDMKAGDDIVNALGGNDTIDGGAGNDTINAGSGNDTLIGNTGDDTLRGGIENDTYIYNLGDGNDIIEDSSGTDTLKLGAGITLDMLHSKTQGNDLILSLDNGESIRLENYTLTSNKIENITLNDGSKIEITSLQVPIEANDTLIYSNTSVTVDAPWWR
ncbi:MAG: hypothetical protein COB42_08920 [Sulfurimonas sp.]|nr:MAG: hypothetical protein COB42_08920 [Sulfurimonas sp.]